MLKQKISEIVVNEVKLRFPHHMLYNTKEHNHCLHPNEFLRSCYTVLPVNQKRDFDFVIFVLLNSLR